VRLLAGDLAHGVVKAQAEHAHEEVDGVAGQVALRPSPWRSPGAAIASKTRCHRRPNPKRQKARKSNEPRPPGPRAEARQPAPARFISLPDAS